MIVQNARAARSVVTVLGFVGAVLLAARFGWGNGAYAQAPGNGFRGLTIAPLGDFRGINGEPAQIDVSLVSTSAPTPEGPRPGTSAQAITVPKGKLLVIERVVGTFGYANAELDDFDLRLDVSTGTPTPTRFPLVPFPQGNSRLFVNQPVLIHVGPDATLTAVVAGRKTRGSPTINGYLTVSGFVYSKQP